MGYFQASSMMNQCARCLLTVDVEDYFQVEAFSGVVRREDWSGHSSRVEANTRRVLGLFEECGVQATFFILGWVAERYARLLEEIRSGGHEVACHSYWHRPVYGLTREQFREDTRRAKRLLEDVTGEVVLGYRAPSFSITRGSLWALEVLVDEGFRYDGSIYTVRHPAYGIPDWGRHPRFVQTCVGPILEIPGCALRLFGANIPCGGGGYMRLLPLCFHRWALRQALERENGWGMVYVHPWELDPGQPRIAAGLVSRVRHYTGLARTEGRLRRLLRQFPASSIKDALETLEGQLRPREAS